MIFSSSSSFFLFLNLCMLLTCFFLLRYSSTWFDDVSEATSDQMNINSVNLFVNAFIWENIKFSQFSAMIGGHILSEEKIAVSK